MAKVTKKQIMDEVNRIIYERARKVVNKIIKDVQVEIRSVIEDFYQDNFSEMYSSNFQPYSYKRKHGMEDMYHITTKKTKRGYKVRFEFAPEFETAQHTQWDGTPGDADYNVYLWDFTYGWHGGPLNKKVGDTMKYGVVLPHHRFAPSPWDRIKQFADNYEIPEV